MADGLFDPVELYRARGLPEAHSIRLALEAEGIAVFIENEHLQGALGELPLGWATSPRVLVNRADEAAAREILKGFAVSPTGNEPQAEGQMSCLACQSPMGDAESCPSCGWTYKPGDESKPADDGSRNPGTEGVPDDSPAATPAEYALPRYPQHVWWEVAAVAAVSIVPYLIALPYHFYHPTPPPPYWLDTLHSFALNCCTVLVVLYLIGRSGESWERFGVTSPKAADVFIGAALMLTAVALSGILWAFTRGTSSSEMFVPPRSDLDYVLMFPKFASIGFTEELVMRCYLITRLSGLLRSRGKAVLLAALLFASYHAYQGISGTVFIFAFGVVYGAVFLAIPRVWPLAIGHAMFNIRVELMAG